MRSLVFLVADLFIKQHIERYQKLALLLSGHWQVSIVSLELPVIFQQMSDKNSGELSEFSKILSNYQKSQKTFSDINRIGFDLLENSGIPIITLWSLINKEDYLELWKVSFETEINNISNLNFNGVNISDCTAIDMSLCIKCRYDRVSSLDLQQQLFLRLTLFGCLLSVKAAEVLHRRIGAGKHDDLRILVPDKYSCYVSASTYFGNHQILTSIFSSSPLDYGKMFIRHLDFSEETIAIYNMQRISREYAKPETMFEYTRLYVQNKIINGNTHWSYSFGFRPCNSVIEFIDNYNSEWPTAVYFTSSPDEQNPMRYTSSILELSSGKRCEQVVRYKDEFDFLSDLIKYCINNKIKLIIRLHPRLGSEARSKSISSHYKIFVDLVETNRANSVMLLQPEDKTSSYWLAAISDLTFFFRSSIGIELNLLGIHSVCPNHLDSSTYQGYPYQLGSLCFSNEDWFFKVFSAVSNSTEPNYLIHQAVRSFYISTTSYLFSINNSTVSLTNIGSSETLEGLSAINRASRYIECGSSVDVPQNRGYWSQDEYINPTIDYLRWLDKNFYSKLSIGRNKYLKIKHKLSSEIYLLRKANFSAVAN